MFTHLHNHTEYSMLDGISRTAIPDLVDRTVELGMSWAPWRSPTTAPSTAPSISTRSARTGA